MSDERISLAIARTVRFVLTHYEAGPMPFTPVAADPDAWWSKMQLLPHDPSELLPKSRAHLEARIARWQELALADFALDEARARR